MTGLRARQVMDERRRFDLCRRLHDEGADLGELFSFISGLYFRGKLAYARAFGKAPRNLAGAYVITPCGGLITPDSHVSLQRLREISNGDIDHANPRYRDPLERDLLSLADTAGAEGQFVLLGSIATAKYVDPLLKILGDKLFFPEEFIGRGDMSRGGMMLRCVDEGSELTYIPAATAARHGSRPPKLARRVSGSAP